MSPFRIAFATAAVSLLAAAPASAATTVFGGSTHAGEPIALTADKAAKKLRTIDLEVDAACADGSSWPAMTRLKPSDLSHNAKGRFAGSSDDVTADGGTLIFGTLEVSGRLAAHRASGTLKLDITSSDGSVECHSGSIHWTATRSPGRIYAGRTSQQEPVVVKVNPKHTGVKDVLIGWETATCTPDHWFRQGDELGGFPVHASHFGNGFSRNFADGNGGTVKLDYAVDGTVKPKASNGTLHVGLTDSDASGATRLTCDSGTIAWKATTG